MPLRRRSQYAHLTTNHGLRRYVHVGDGAEEAAGEPEPGHVTARHELEHVDPYLPRQLSRSAFVAPAPLFVFLLLCSLLLPWLSFRRQHHLLLCLRWPGSLRSTPSASPWHLFFFYFTTFINYYALFIIIHFSNCVW
jgi:hypothetical protein